MAKVIKIDADTELHVTTTRVVSLADLILEAAKSSPALEETVTYEVR